MLSSEDQTWYGLWVGWALQMGWGGAAYLNGVGEGRSRDQGEVLS